MAQQVFVDYTILSPFGKMANSRGPFTSDKDVAEFIKKLSECHKTLLLKAEVRQAIV